MHDVGDMLVHSICRTRHAVMEMLTTYADAPAMIVT
jgi:hypothetical protein